MPYYPAVHRPKVLHKNVRELPVRVLTQDLNRYRPTIAAVDVSRQTSLVSSVYAQNLGLVFPTAKPRATDKIRTTINFQLVNHRNGSVQHSADFSLAFDVADASRLNAYQPNSRFSAFQVNLVLSMEFLKHKLIRKYTERRLANSGSNVLVIELYPEFCRKT